MIPPDSLPCTDLARSRASLPRRLETSTYSAPVSSTLSLTSEAASTHRFASSDCRPDSIPSRPWKSAMTLGRGLLTAFAGRGQHLTIDAGWREVADACLDWLNRQGR